MKERILETIGLIGLILLLTIAYSIGYSQNYTINFKEVVVQYDYTTQIDETGNYEIDLTIMIVKLSSGEYALIGFNNTTNMGDYHVSCKSISMYENNITQAIITFKGKDEVSIKGLVLLNPNVATVMYEDDIFFYLR